MVGFACNMPPIRLREGLAFLRDIPSAKHNEHPEEKPGLPESRWETFSLKIEGQDWQCIFHAFLHLVGRITNAFPL